MMAGKTGKIITGVAAFLLLGAGGAWYVVTGNLVKNATSLAAKAASKTLADGSSYTLTYESITRTSFPTIGVRVVNPVYTLTAPADEAKAQGPFTFTVTLKGTLDTTTDYLANAYRVVTDGSYAMRATIGSETIGASSNAPSIMKASIKAKDRASFAQWNALDWKDSTQTAQAWKTIAAISYDMGPLVLSDANGALLIGSEAMAFGLVNRSTQAEIDGDLMLRMKAVEISEAYNQMAARLMKNARVPLPMDLGQMPFAAVRAGKQDMDIDLSVKLPQGLAQGAEPRGSITASKLMMKNDFYTLSMPLALVLGEANGQRNLSLKMDWSLEATPAGAAETARLVDMVAGFAPVASDVSSLSAEMLKEKITVALPTLSSLGPIRLSVDMQATSPVQAAPAADGAAPAPVATSAVDSVMLKEFAFTHKRWGLEAKGTSLNNASGATIDMALVCKQCDTLTQDVFTTAQQAQDVMNVSKPERPQWPLTPELLQNINATLADIGTKSAQGDVTFAFTTPKAGEVAVNGKPIAEVGPKLMALFMAVQPAPAPVQEQQPAQ